jgi:DNA-binding response OmpR family regulator
MSSPGENCFFCERGDQHEAVDVRAIRCDFDMAMPRVKAARRSMDATILIADADFQSHREIRRFFSNSGFSVAGVTNALECRAAFSALEPDVLIVALEIPRGGGGRVTAWLNGSLRPSKYPLVLVVGDASVETLSARTGVARGNCFSKPLNMETLLDRIGMEFALRLLPGAHG